MVENTVALSVIWYALADVCVCVMFNMKFKSHVIKLPAEITPLTIV